MTTTNQPAPNKVRKPGTLYRIAGCLFAITALVTAIGGGYTSQVAVYVALSAVFLLLAKKKARQAQQPQDTKAPKV